MGVELSALHSVETIVCVDDGYHFVDDGLYRVVVLIPSGDDRGVAGFPGGELWIAVTIFCTAWSPRMINAGLSPAWVPLSLGS